MPCTDTGDFGVSVAACALAKQRPARSHSPFQIRDRAARLLRRALLRIR